MEHLAKLAILFSLLGSLIPHADAQSMLGPVPNLWEGLSPNESLFGPIPRFDFADTSFLTRSRRTESSIFGPIPTFTSDRSFDGGFDYESEIFGSIPNLLEFEDLFGPIPRLQSDGTFE